ncbi:rRNA methyltransferase 3, mitochondrial-like [Crassostrea angulata]|uniref:rRNA methyltransferase 3, mitochondrial-like n=1 Tax=Magallana angulata TaxID=2784310 RepID=UPI0022B0A964|nr:rRNA methyltransferase 3, mitochondrial-like [Crassostrea angulata]
MAASMRHNFIKPIIPMYAHNMHFRNKSSNANSTNEMKNPKENAGHYFHPRKNQKYKKVQGSSIGKSNLLQSYPGVRQLDEITGDHVNELVDSKSAAGIEKTQTIFLEGEKIIRQAVKAGIHFKSVYTTEVKLLEKLELGEAQQYITKVKALKSWVSQKAVESDGIICAVAQKPDPSVSETENRLPVTVVMDRITDPWTAGVLLRTAHGVGCRRFVTTKGCCNMWDSEVLTASDGSHFYMPIQTNLSWNVLKQNGEAEEYTCTRRKVIFTSARPMTFQAILKAEEKFLTDNLEDEDTDALDNDSSPTSLSKSAEKSGFQLTNFNEVDLSNADVFTLIISDDTLKVSNQKIKFLYENDAVLASVPMTSGLTKLNPTVPGTLMLYHLLGQLTSNKV